MNSIYDNLQLLPQDIQGWNSNSKVFEELILITNGSLIIEVGSWKGASAINMANIIKKYNLNKKIICVDTWLGALEFIDDNSKDRNLLLKNGYPNIYYQFLSNVVHTDNQNIISPFPNTSSIAARYFNKKNITADLIYIDASHDFEDVYSDIKSYYEILNKGGIIFGDDFSMWWPGVKKAVELFCSEQKISFEVKENNFWIIKK